MYILLKIRAQKFTDKINKLKKITENLRLQLSVTRDINKILYSVNFSSQYSKI